MRRAWLLVLLAGCLPAPHYVKLVEYEPAVAEVTRPDTTDADLFAAAVWLFGDALVTAWREEGVIKTGFEAVGIVKTGRHARARVFQRLAFRTFEGGILVVVDCRLIKVSTTSLGLPSACEGRRVDDGWQAMASDAAKWIIEDADHRAARRAERRTGTHHP